MDPIIFIAKLFHYKHEIEFETNLLSTTNDIDVLQERFTG